MKWNRFTLKTKTVILFQIEIQICDAVYANPLSQAS